MNRIILRRYENEKVGKRDLIEPNSLSDAIYSPAITEVTTAVRQFMTDTRLGYDFKVSDAARAEAWRIAQQFEYTINNVVVIDFGRLKLNYQTYCLWRSDDPRFVEVIQIFTSIRDDAVRVPFYGDN